MGFSKSFNKGVHTMTKPYPYIGVTGFMRQEEVVAAWAEASKKLHRSKHILMIGCLVSHKTLLGQTNKWPNRYPPIEKLTGIFPPKDESTLNLVHYHTTDQSTLYNQLVKISELVGSHLDGYQLNIRWPDIEQLLRYKDDYPDHKIVLQCGSEAMSDVDNEPKALADAIDTYEYLVDYVLIDPSGGKGQAINIVFAGECLEAITKICPWVVPGIAGGLGPNTISHIESLAHKYPNLCIDAEGRLRDEEDNIHLGKIRTYIKEAYDIF